MEPTLIPKSHYWGSLAKGRDLSRLAEVRVLIVDNDPHIANMVSRMLNHLGFKSTHVARDGKEGVAMLIEHEVDLVLTEWPMFPEAGTDIVSYIRRRIDKKYRSIPIILLTGKASMDDIVTARDAGITEFVVKPFTVNSLCGHIIQVIENPRPFVQAPGYIGPSRRRREADGDEENGNRMSEEEKAKCTVYENGVTKIITDQGEVIISEPEFTIRRKIGPDIDMDALFSDDSIAEAQDMVQDNLGEFMEWAGVDMIWLEHNFKLLKKRVEPKERLEHIGKIAMSIHSKASTFSYILARDISQSLYEYVDAIETINKEHLIVIRKHMDTLYVIFHQNITGEAGMIGRELMQTLNKLKTRYPSHH